MLIKTEISENWVQNRDSFKTIDNFDENLDFSQNFGKSRFWWKFSNISILIKKNPKISISAKIYKSLDFREYLQKSRF